MGKNRETDMGGDLRGVGPGLGNDSVYGGLSLDSGLNTLARPPGAGPYTLLNWSLQLRYSDSLEPMGGDAETALEDTKES